MRFVHSGGSLALVALCVAAPPAFAHQERDIASPIRPGPVPPIDRVNPSHIVVCKPTSKPTAEQLADIQARLQTATGDDLTTVQAELAAWNRNAQLFDECCFQHIQDAVNAAGDNTDIFVMPGVYREEPSRAAPTSHRGDLPNGSYSFEYHVAHPNDASLIAVLGKHNITIEGTGATPRDVLIDAGYVKDVGIRADRVTGFIARNFWEKDANEHGVYVVDSDGYIYDRLIGSFNKEYELFGFASDNGLMTDCEVIGGGDSGFYIGGAPDTHALGRFSQVIQRSKMHHNALGFSGTQGTSVQITECDVYDNAIGISFNSQNDHPNFPQRYAVIENNDIHDNNFDIYAATSDLPPGGPAYDFFRYPVGTGMWIIGGDNNIVRNNRIYNNSRFGAILAGNALERPRPAKVNGNQFIDNLVGSAAGNGAGPNSTALPVGDGYPPGFSDFLWDETGMDNCFGPLDGLKTDPSVVPGPCPFPNPSQPLPIEKAALLLSCSLEAVPGSNPTQYVTTDSAFACPWGHVNNGPYENADQRECENGQIDVGEDCDPGAADEGVAPNLGGQTCASLSHGDGTLGCDHFCQWDFSSCSISSPLPTPTLRAGCPVPPTSTPTPMATPTPKPCIGDCLGGGSVTIDELLTMVNIALGTEPLSACLVGDTNHDGSISIDEILVAVNSALDGCS
jgi:hypothetical protein